MSHWRRSPRPLGMALDGVRDELAPATLLAEIQQVWPEELDLMGPVIVERLNEVLERGSVTRLRCIAMPSG